MKHLSEGRKMFLTVMVIFVVYAVIFILFEDYDRHFLRPFMESSDLHLMLFSIVVMIILGVLLHRYSHRMDERISKEQADKETKMRRELTQNISHELKTPVSSILGYTETILDHPDMDDDTRRQFIERTQSQAHRLSALLQDISTLNRMDYAADMFSMKPVDVSRIVADIVKETELTAISKNIVVCNCMSQDIIVNGNESLIYSIFSNLMDNALNYAGDWTTVIICAFEHDDEWNFTFSDNGVGIDAEHLPRIFERFYRIDKGRSRSLGGTGLGLSIVKNAVMLHGGSIIAKTEEGGGLRFEFTLKKNGANR
jgi:two-component system OmpR family sensor kinase/two-component system phosphate regulon sensor histidine kinase PhoR